MLDKDIISSDNQHLVENNNDNKPSSQRLFTYNFNNGLGSTSKTLKLKVDLENFEDPVELASRVANYHDIPCFIKSGGLRNVQASKAIIWKVGVQMKSSPI